MSEQDQAGDQAVTGKPAPAGKAIKGFDFARHADVQSLRKSGIWTWLGERFGDLEVRLIPFYEARVVVRREAAEQAVRMQLTLADDDPIPGERGIEINRAAVNEAIAGARGNVRGTPEVLRIARKHGMKTDGDWVIFTGTEDPDAIREVFAPIVEVSMSLLTTLARASRELHKVNDEELASLGEAFVYGRQGKAAWAD